MSKIYEIAEFLEKSVKEGSFAHEEALENLRADVENAILDLRSLDGHVDTALDFHDAAYGAWEGAIEAVKALTQE